MKFCFVFLVFAAVLEGRGLGGGLLEGGCHPWEAVNRRTSMEHLPWFLEELDPDVRVALEGLDLSEKTLLDIGMGAGTQALALAQDGYLVTGIDISATAVQSARERAELAGCSVDFVEDNILASHLSGQFGVALDRGCLHVLDPEEWESYRASVCQLLRSGGYLLLKTYSSREPMHGGPHHFSSEEVEELFGADFDMVYSEETVYQGQFDPAPRALFCILKKKTADGETPSAANG